MTEQLNLVQRINQAATAVGALKPDKRSGPKPMTDAEKSASLIKRFWASVNRSGDAPACWLWIGTRTKAGYGLMGIGKHTLVYTHRLAWEIAYGSIPDGLHVCHTCDNPACANPRHLFLGTQADNNADKVKKNRQAKGQSIKSAKLTPEKAEEIRTAYAKGDISQSELAKRYGVYRHAIRCVLNNWTWRI